MEKKGNGSKMGFRTAIQRVYKRYEARKQQAKYCRVGAVNPSIVKLRLTKGAYQVFHSNGFKALKMLNGHLGYI